MANGGLVIYFDGPDGVGKTTQLKLVAEELRESGREVHATRTMGGTPIGEMLREALLSGNDRPVETDLHIALASQHALAKEIIDKRREGRVVLIDRSPLSIVAYQVFGDGLASKKGYQAAQELLDLIKPDRVIVYTAPSKELKERRQHRNHQIGNDFFEIKPFEYHDRVAKGFKEATGRFKATVIDASGSIDEVHQSTLQRLSDILTVK
jgi:dTMP kinase